LQFGFWRGVFGTIGITTLGCGGAGGAARAIRPDATTGSAALGETECRDVSRGSKPLVVDWKPEQRGDLEVAMSEGVAVVAYDCQKMELLTDCRVEGSYGFKGVVLKQQVIRLADADEIKMNLPLSGAAIVAKLDSELARGVTLDLATALVGNLTSTRVQVGRAELAGQCDGATHFVRGANIGAFVMQAGNSASAATSASLFGAGAGAGSSSSRLSRVEDGRLDACETVEQGPNAPPRNCSALIRVHLVPIAAVAEVSVKAEAALVDVACPEGTVLSEGKCTKPAAGLTHQCQRGDAKDCSAQCEQGERSSCHELGRLYLDGASGLTRDVPRARVLLDKSCGLDDAGGCSDLGIALMTGEAGTNDPVRAAASFDRACKLGEANGCFNLANLHYDGTGVSADKAKAFTLYEQSCNAGKAAGCINLGAAYDDGEGVAIDKPKAFSLFKRACEGDEAIGCSNLAFMFSQGSGTAPDQAQAARYYERGCTLGNAKSCEYIGTRYLEGNGVEKNADKGRALLKRACDGGTPSACTLLGAASGG
jgi:TPR repeat protein